MKIAFLFPGQGAQKQNMGKSFYENDADSRAVFDSVKTVTGIDACDLIFKDNDELNNTRYTQIAMVATGIAMLKAVEKTGLKADICAGLSLGEYEALYLSGAISADDAIAIVDKRGQYMSEIKGGAMSAVLSLDNDTIKSVVDDIDGCWVANYNCPGQTVISGTKEAVALAGEKLKEAGAKRVLPLKVSGAFHSGLMKEAGEKLAKVLEEQGYENFIHNRGYARIENTTFINSQNPDLVISLHCNSSDNLTATGTEAIHFPGSKNGIRFATILSKNVSEALGIRNRGAKEPYQGRGDGLLRRLKAPAVISEPFFIDNNEDLKKAFERKNEYIQAIVKSINEYFEIK